MGQLDAVYESCRLTVRHRRCPSCPLRAVATARHRAAHQLPIRMTGVSTRKYGLELVTPMSSIGLETRLSINPFDELGGSYFVAVSGEEQHEMIGVRK